MVHISVYSCKLLSGALQFMDFHFFVVARMFHIKFVSSYFSYLFFCEVHHMLFQSYVFYQKVSTPEHNFAF